MTPDNVIETLEAAHITLCWYRDMLPGSVNGSDDEMDAQIKAAVEWLRGLGVQEPVAMLHDDGYWTPMKTEAGRALNERLMRAGSLSIEVYTAAPAAQQYEAGDIASASAQGFRDGVASVAQQYEAGDIASASAQGFRDGVASVTQQEPVAWAMPKGDGTFIDVITPAEHAREEGSYTVPLFARPVAQQPQARPDFTDEWAGYLKDGETPFERFLRERKDMQSVLKLYQRVLEENERLKGQQPQAEAVSDDLRERLVAIGAAIADQDDRAAQAMIREILAAPQQAEVTKTVATHDDTDLIEQMLEALRLCSGVPHWPALIPTIDAALKRLETPQQAEAVPEGYKLLKDTTHQDRSWPEDATHENGCYHNTCVNCLRGFTGHKRRGICRSCDALTKP